jgi:hypothetical protein
MDQGRATARSVPDASGAVVNPVHGPPDARSSLTIRKSRQPAVFPAARKPQSTSPQQLMSPHLFLSMPQEVNWKDLSQGRP